MTWTGAIFIDSTNNLASFYVRHDEFIGELNAACPSRWALLFAVSGPDEAEVKAIIEAVFQATHSLSLPVPHQMANSGGVGNCYVYAYFDHGQAIWDQCFYVGKGTANGGAPHLGRWTEHIKVALATAPASYNEKMRRIHAWVARRNLDGDGHISVRAAAAGDLVRKLYVFEGEFAESCAFYVEYFLITHAMGTHRIANDTNGNSTCGLCTAIALPRHLNRTDALHEAVWRNTVDEFAVNPNSKKLGNTWRPASIALFAAPFAATLDAYLAPLGLIPHPMSQQGRLTNNLMPRLNIQVTGASDATLTYSNPACPHYRIELRFGATQCLTNISLRPLSQTKNGISAFLTYMDSCVISAAALGEVHTNPVALSLAYGHNTYIKNRSDWPFYKPFAPGSEGNNSTWFDIADPTAPASGSTDWIVDGHFDLNLVQAIDLIIRAFQ